MAHESVVAGSIDFGAVSYEPTEAQWAQLPDVLLVPLLGQAGLASYNVKALLRGCVMLRARSAVMELTNRRLWIPSDT